LHRLADRVEHREAVHVLAALTGRHSADEDILAAAALVPGILPAFLRMKHPGTAGDAPGDEAGLFVNENAHGIHSFESGRVRPRRSVIRFFAKHHPPGPDLHDTADE